MLVVVVYVLGIFMLLNSGYFMHWRMQVVWGEASMIQAERLLLTAALQDPLNERFFLLSDRYFDPHCLCKALLERGSYALTKEF